MTAVSPSCVLVTGGEHFKGRHNISSSVLVCLYSRSARTASWYRLKAEAGGGRAAHCMVSLSSGLYVLGGRSERRILPNISRLRIN